MRRLILIIQLILITMTVSAQKEKPDARYQQYEGRYGSNSGVCLFTDGTFLLYGYATGVFGHYKFEKDHLLFYPDKLELFKVYAHQNKNLIDSMRINYMGFQDGKTFIQFDQDSVHRVFNDDANCFDAPFVNQPAKSATTITLSAVVEDPERETELQHQSWTYTLAKGQNDLILIYNKPKREYQDFRAVIETAEGKSRLVLSNYGGEEGYIKQSKDEDEQRQWQEILSWKTDYDQSKNSTNNDVFANKHYHSFSRPDLTDYILDQTANQYVMNHAADNEDYFRNDQYNDNRYLRKYEPLKPKTKRNIEIAGKNIATGSIFFTACGEGAEKSYHYDGYLPRQISEDDTIPLIEVPAVPIPPYENPNKIDDSVMQDSHDVGNDTTSNPIFQPFAVDREDGFYRVEKKDNSDSRKTILSKQPALTRKDIADVKFLMNEFEQAIVQIKFTATGAEKLRLLTESSIGQAIALVVAGKVISMPIVTGTIATGDVHIAGTGSVAEAKEIAKQLQPKN